MSAVIDVCHEEKARLLGQVVLRDCGTHRMEIVNVGNYCPAEDTIYLHLSSTEKFTNVKNGRRPVQYCGWYYVPHLELFAGPRARA